MVKKLIDRTPNVNLHITPHSFRRSFATYKYRNKVPLEKIARLMGHESVDTTMEYIIPDDKADLMDIPSNLSFL